VDKLEIEILPDGTIKTTTGKVGAVNHQNAEAFLNMLARETGGVTKREKRGDHDHHDHSHSHTHDHSH